MMDIPISVEGKANSLKKYFSEIAEYKIIPVSHRLTLNMSVVPIGPDDLMYTAYSSTGLAIDHFQSKKAKVVIFSNTLGGMSEFFLDAKISPAELSGAIFDLAALKKVVHGCDMLNRVFVLDKSPIEALLAGLLEGPVDELIFSPIFPARSPGVKMLGQIASIMTAATSRSDGFLQFPLASANLQECIRHVVLEGFEHNFSDNLRRPRSPALPRYIRRARDYIHSNLDRPLSILDIAADCGASPRSLQLGFRRFLDTTPRAYIQAVRLQQVHGDLINEENRESVTEVALKWGFTHLSRFSELYRQHYGVSPSQTRRQQSTARALIASNSATGAGLPKRKP
jgi:AraC-like DNA-binding protein